MIGQPFLFSFNLKAILYKKKDVPGIVRCPGRVVLCYFMLLIVILYYYMMSFGNFRLKNLVCVSQGQAHGHTEYSGQRYPLFFAGGKACGHTEYSGRFCRKTISRLSSEAACILCFLPCFRQQAGRVERALRLPPLPCYLYFLLSF